MKYSFNIFIIVSLKLLYAGSSLNEGSLSNLLNRTKYSILKKIQKHFDLIAILCINLDIYFNMPLLLSFNSINFLDKSKLSTKAPETFLNIENILSIIS